MRSETAGAAAALDPTERAPRVYGAFFSAALVLVSCVLSQGFLPVGRFLGRVEVLDPGVSDPWANTLQAFVLLTMIVGTLLNYRRVLPILSYGKWMVPIFAYCILSTLWSDAPGTTARRALILFTYLVFGYFIYAMVGTRGALRLLSVGAWVMVACSLALYVALPKVGGDVPPYEGALRGIFSQKNITAWAFMIGLTYVGYYLYALRRVPWWLPPSVLVYLACIVLTKSTTEVLACGLVIAFWGWSFIFRACNQTAKLALAWLTLAAAAGVVALVLSLGNELFTLIGKDPTLTGRDVIWQAARYVISLRPWFGYGFQGFWNPDSAMTQKAWEIAGWQPPHAHNGILELLIEQGRVGALLFLIFLGNLVRLIVKGLRYDSPEAWWCVSWLILVVFKGLTEPVYMELDISVALMTFSTIALTAQDRARRPVRSALRARPLALGFASDGLDHPGEASPSLQPSRP